MRADISCTDSMASAGSTSNTDVCRGMPRLVWWLGGLLTAQELLTELAPPELPLEMCAIGNPSLVLLPFFAS